MIFAFVMGFLGATNFGDLTCKNFIFIFIYFILFFHEFFMNFHEFGGFPFATNISPLSPQNWRFILACHKIGDFISLATKLESFSCHKIGDFLGFWDVLDFHVVIFCLCYNSKYDSFRTSLCRLITRDRINGLRLRLLLNMESPRDQC